MPITKKEAEYLVQQSKEYIDNELSKIANRHKLKAHWFESYMQAYNGGMALDQSTFREYLRLCGENPVQIELSYEELIRRLEEEELITGSIYRIKDYTCETVTAGTTSAHHDFDIIVMSTSSNTLSETAFAAPKEQDSYYSAYGANLGAWQLKYCIYNDTERFAWAKSDGKGVIYYMKDEFGNVCPYDFKSILINGTMTFSSNATSREMVGKGKIINNVISPCYSANGGAMQLPMNVFRNDVNAVCYGNFLGLNCTNNTFSSDCCENIIASESSNNVLGYKSFCNRLEQGCCNNSLGVGFIRFVEFEQGVSGVTLTSTSSIASIDNQLQNIVVHKGVNGTLQDITRGNTFLTNIYSKDVEDIIV